MPKLVDYLSYARPARSYDEIELTRLQLVYERDCHVIGVNVSDPRRETIAVLVFQQPISVTSQMRFWTGCWPYRCRTVARCHSVSV